MSKTGHDPHETKLHETKLHDTYRITRYLLQMDIYYRTAGVYN